MEWLPFVQQIIASAVGTGVVGTLAVSYSGEKLRDAYQRVRDAEQHQNELALKSVDYEHQLRLAALERKLDVHQGAYARWWKLQSKMYPRDADAAKESPPWRRWSRSGCRVRGTGAGSASPSSCSKIPPTRPASCARWMASPSRAARCTSRSPAGAEPEGGTNAHGVVENPGRRMSTRPCRESFEG
jgi:hypothetical protein